LWFYLAQLQALDGKAAETATALAGPLPSILADRVTNQNQTPHEFHDLVRQDKSFDRVRQTPEFQKGDGELGFADLPASVGWAKEGGFPPPLKLRRTGRIADCGLKKS